MLTVKREGRRCGARCALCCCAASEVKCLDVLCFPFERLDKTYPNACGYFDMIMVSIYAFLFAGVLLYGLGCGAILLARSVFACEQDGVTGIASLKCVHWNRVAFVIAWPCISALVIWLCLFKIPDWTSRREDIKHHLTTTIQQTNV